MADKKLFFYVTFLLSFSVIICYSLSAYAIDYYGYGEFHFLIRQSIAVIIGILVIWILSQIPADKLIIKLGFFILISSILLLVVMPFLPESLASSAGGAKRWIRLPGFSLAPSEFFKIGFIVFLAWSFSRKFVGQERDSLFSEFGAFIPYIVFFSIVAILIVVMQNDLGQAILMAIILMVMLLFAGGSKKLAGMLLVLAFSLGALAIVTSEHRINRIKTWWGGTQDLVLSILPEQIAQNMRIENTPEPYQIYYSISAINNGGFIGLGLGNGVIKLGFLSEVHTDIVLAGLSEELGLIGLGIFIIIFILILHRILKIANRTTNNIYSLFCIGVCVMFGFSFLINAFGITGIIPIKGIAVPFLSYGGSAVLASCIAIGMVLSISKTINKD
ncbi:FtsW/RodA/SpoVE family cell cycle protein [Helicobacter sp. MIT 14-3879]|uniref:FtsW/RodA/SpoVE family cell cycle protein n=1 Tax=Helicobacter sp. MIT 14-3879 TaxID=2040649 RepID=UPI000E1E8BE9|nr:FtsW/RodA/SpoVE family cell cycle protein [Helicobacter sp. MIT 14-3879]RDU63517.1 cell division protein [Helicobacter sp. MIT 14-3879]